MSRVTWNSFEQYARIVAIIIPLNALLCSQFQLVEFVFGVFADVIGGVVHAHDASVDGEERPVEALRDGAVEVLALVLRHDEYHLGRVADVVVLRHTHYKISQWNRPQFTAYLRFGD